MKSAHRHQLETNSLAHRLEVYIERYKPYASTIVGVLIAVVVLILIWSYFSGSSAAKRSEAWDTFHHAVGANPPRLDELRGTAQEHPNTPLQELADVTWADSQVYIASRNYLINRQAAMGMLEKATSAYQVVVQSSEDERLRSRAHLGLARVYEMQNELGKARDEYRKVTGTYAKYAQQQAERLEKPDAQEAYTWLATAQIPRPPMPVGPGTPGQRPEFSPGEMALPGTTGAPGTTGDAKGAADSIENLFKSLKENSKLLETGDRYKTDQKSASDAATNPSGKDTPTSESKDSKVPASNGTNGSKPAESPPAESPPADSTPAGSAPAGSPPAPQNPPAEEKSAK